ncbi:helicase [Corynebacterium sp. 13CS0277]|nr:helicase [Corynebacterium sp. 13CS0277]
MIIEARDEEWLITEAKPSRRGQRLKVRGVSEFVRDEVATFYTELDPSITPLDADGVTLKLDTSPRYRHTRLWIETNLRKTPESILNNHLTVSKGALVDVLDYQRQAVEKALSPQNVRPRILLADAVGLGKTIEIGMILSELVQRGRGDRILIVSPKHVLEQMQKEMWNRFALPFVRLDTAGIQKVRQKLPATRNPFSYFNRAIISIDTLKMPKYRSYLEKSQWDAVVIDEAHNLTNTDTQNNDLARLLAPRTEALILASATPHNGKSESFAELIRLLDPAAVAPDDTISKVAIDRLVVRRHRYSPEVSSVVGEQWAERAEPENKLVEPSVQEQRLADELRAVWLGDNSPSVSRLFPWSLFKASLSSPLALLETIDNRRHTLQQNIADAATNSKVDAEQCRAELAALEELRRLAAELTYAEGADALTEDGVTEDAALDFSRSNKFAALVDYLTEIGVKKGSSTRAVIFVERRKSIEWLKAGLEQKLTLGKDAIDVMHGGLSDEEQMQVVERFKQGNSKTRILITGDIASEGVNLHAECHHLIHYDIPWSLIRVQQRNGRIDRYQQRKNPVIATLLLDTTSGFEGTDTQGRAGDVSILTRLMEREREANERLGDVASIMGKYNEKAEEDAIRDVLAGKTSFEDAVPDIDSAQAGGFLALLRGSNPLDDAATGAASEPDSTSNSSGTSPRRVAHASLYPNESSFLLDALNEAFDSRPHNDVEAGGVSLVESSPTITLCPPPDLQRRFEFLPDDYVSDNEILKSLQLTGDPVAGGQFVEDARKGKGTKNNWPHTHFLGPLHPVSDWAVDRALSSMRRQETPVVRGNVNAPTILIMGTLSNQLGQTISRAFLQYTIADDGTIRAGGVTDADAVTHMLGVMPTIADIHTWFKTVGLSDKDLSNRPIDDAAFEDNFLPVFKAGVENALTAANGFMSSVVMESAKEDTATYVHSQEARLDAWLETPAPSTGRKYKEHRKRVQQYRDIATRIEPESARVKPLVLLVPHNFDATRKAV